jgi:STE24 endopeptidase
MRNCGTAITGGAHGRATRFGLWRAAVAAPPVLGSLLLGSVAVGGLDLWAGPVLLIWVGCGAAALTRVGERVAVRAAFGFCRPTPMQTAVLHPLWVTALRLAETPEGAVELYVQRARQPNAYAAGGHSVAVTSRVLEDYRTGRMSDAQVVAVLVHELGHHATGATRPLLIAMWLAAPWRATTRLLTRVGSTLTGCQSRRGLGIAGLAGVVAAVVQAVHQRHWVAGGVVAAVALCAVVCPLADAWVCRRAEFAADRFAADRGLALELAAALRTLDDGSMTPSGWPRRLVASHPPSGLRIRALLSAPHPGARSRMAFWLP